MTVCHVVENNKFLYEYLGFMNK